MEIHLDKYPWNLNAEGLYPTIFTSEYARPKLTQLLVSHMEKKQSLKNVS